MIYDLRLEIWATALPTIYKYIIDTDIGADYENMNYVHMR